MPLDAFCVLIHIPFIMSFHATPKSFAAVAAAVAALKASRAHAVRALSIWAIWAILPKGSTGAA